MNPALPIIALAVACTGWMARRRPHWRGPALACLVATALVAPVLVDADAVPSAAGQLADHAPWLDAESQVHRNDDLRDVTYQVQPWLLFLRHELRSGRLPLWNPHQQAGTPYWANGSSAPLFPLHLLFVALPVQLGLVLLPWLRAVTAVWGAWLLARELDLSESASALAGVTFGLAGMSVSFLLYPMGSAIALAPWVLWATERLASGRAARTHLAVAASLQLLAGHPETSVHTAFLAGLYLLIRLGFSRWRRWRDAAVAGVLAGLVSMVHLLPFALFVTKTSRWLQWDLLDRTVDLGLVLPQTARLVLPFSFGASWDGTWFGPFTAMALALYVGGLGLVLAVAGTARARRDRRWTALTALTVVSLLAALQTPGVREAIELLPIVGRALHHRLVFGFQLGAALLAGAGLDRWRQIGRPTFGSIAVVGAALGSAWLGLASDWRVRGLLEPQVGWTLALVLGVLGIWVVGRSDRTRSFVPVVVVAFAAADLLAAHGRLNPALDIEHLYPDTPAVERLRSEPGRLAGVGGTYHPNAAMVHGLYDLRGDDSVKLDRYERAYASAFDAGHPTYYVPIRRWNEEALDRFSVAWIMGPPGRRAPGTGWILEYDGADATVWRRPNAEPMVRWSPVDAEPLEPPPRILDRRPGGWTIETERAGVVEIAEIWDEGWNAKIDGEPVPTRDGGPFVRLETPAGRHTIMVRYLPPGLRAGAVLSLLGLLGIAAAPRLLSEAGGGRSAAGARHEASPSSA